MTRREACDSDRSHPAVDTGTGREAHQPRYKPVRELTVTTRKACNSDRSRLTVKVVVGLACVLLAGCAGTPKQPPQCEGPWVPVNAPVETRDGT